MSALLEVDRLCVGFRTPRGTVQALSEVDLRLDAGELLVVVGESGSGKSVLAHSLLRLLPENVEMSGSARLQGRELLTMSDPELRQVRGRRVALIPQSPASALNPVRRLGPLLLEAAAGHGLGPAEARAALTSRLGELDLDFDRLSPRYVHHLSGGMQQRVVNALALVGEPELVVADEPTSGLDASLVDATAEQLASIPRRGAALIVITHDLRLAERLGGTLVLLYASRVVEVAPTREFFAHPRHPYGRELLRALPERGGRPIPHLPPELTDLPDHCTFAARCPDVFVRCRTDQPALVSAGPDRSSRCFAHADC